MAKLCITRALPEDPIVFRFSGRRSEDGKRWLPGGSTGKVYHIALRVGQWAEGTDQDGWSYYVRSLGSACGRQWRYEGDPGNPTEVKWLSEIEADQVCRGCANRLSRVED